MNGNNKKVIFVTHYSNLYGANLSLLSLINGLKEYGVKAFVVAPSRGDLTDELMRREIPFCVAPFRNWMTRSRWKAPGRLFLTLVTLPYVAYKALIWEADHVHSNSSVTPMGALLSEVLSLPHTWHIREFGDRDFSLKHDWGEPVFRAILNRADAAIAVSKSVKKYVLSDITIPKYVVYNGVISNQRLEQIRNQSYYKSKSTNTFTFSLVGRISPAKGQKQAVRALGMLKDEVDDVRLIFAGSGDDKYVRSLKKLVIELGLEQSVVFQGYVADPYEVYKQSDAVLMCSPHEAMGRVTAEAMAAMCPVIGRDSDASSEIIDHKKNGLLYDGSDKELFHCMKHLMENREVARCMGVKGWKKAKSEFTNEIYAKRIYEIISSSNDSI